MTEERYLTTAEVARRLDVKPETVYTYVSRGLLTNTSTGRKRGSLFALSEVDRLAQRGREAHEPSGAVERIRTGITLIDKDELYYRGHRVRDLAGSWPVEAVAELLWGGELGQRPPFSGPERMLAAAKAASAALPEQARLTDRIRVAVAAAGAVDPLRFDLAPRAVTRSAGLLLGTLVDLFADGTAHGSVGERLWPGLSSAPARPELLDTALVLLADHGLAVSTVAARVAASARANVYAVISAGLGAIDGPYHGAASALAYRFLAEAKEDPVTAIADRMRSGQPIPGFGHVLYQCVDPRAEVLLDLLRDQPIQDTVDVLRITLGDREDLFPNIDLALAALMHAYDMPHDAGETLFALARVVGWVAHAIEEYAEPGLRYRALGIYTGADP
ncbi:citrate synthase [Sciscionella marina]|uniref:citrate synthase n=1 Tax=Sciscionella marina TaxID=508770 RepID=UPI000375A26C|nr:citrate synthase [Sciscionella marina]